MSYNLFTVTRPDLNHPPMGNAGFSDRNAKFQWEFGLNHLPPYVYRIVTPLLARLIASTTNINVAYYIITTLALAAAALFIGLSILELTGSEVPALAGMVLFVANPFSAKFNLRDYMLTDPMAFFLAALAIWALVSRRRFLFFAVCAVGVLNKESMVPMVLAYPLTEVWLEHHLRPSSVAAAAGIVVGYTLFRVVTPEATTGYTMLNQLNTDFVHIKSIVAMGIVVFGIALPAALRRPWGSSLIVALLPFAIACVLEAWFASDLGRVMAQALPAVCVAIFWLWPADLPRQLLTLAVVPLALVQMAIVVLFKAGFAGDALLGSVFLTLVAFVAEVWLWRLSIDVVRPPDAHATLAA
jgi:hypothetical protein